MSEAATPPQAKRSSLRSPSSPEARESRLRAIATARAESVIQRVEDLDHLLLEAGLHYAVAERLHHTYNELVAQAEDEEHQMRGK